MIPKGGGGPPLPRQLKSKILVFPTVDTTCRNCHVRCADCLRADSDCPLGASIVEERSEFGQSAKPLYLFLRETSTMSSHRVLRVLGVVLALSAMACVRPTISHAGLIGHYSYNDADDLGIDSSGNGYHGVVVGDVTAAAGVSGGGAKFGAAIGNYIALPFADILADGNIPTSNFTLAAWCNVVNTAGTTPSSMLGQTTPHITHGLSTRRFVRVTTDSHCVVTVGQ